MDFPQSREPLPIVALEVGVETLLGVDPQELAYDLHRQHFRIAKFGLGATSPQLLLPHKLVIHLIENGYDEGVKIHESRDLLLASVGLDATERREVSLFIQPFAKTCTRG